VTSVRVNIYEGRLDAFLGGTVGELVNHAMAAGVESATRLAPYLSGDLSRSVGVRESAHPDGNGVVGTYGAGNSEVDYALHVEFGTMTGPEQPYLRPSVDAVIAAASGKVKYTSKAGNVSYVSEAQAANWGGR
jgi:hypothetical protein